MKTYKYKHVKVGESYYFVDTDFQYINPKIRISKERINQKITGDFSTRNPGDRYEMVRHFAYPTESDARERAVKDLKSYKKSICKTIDDAIEQYKKPLPAPKGE